MAYADYDFYRDVYSGKLSESDYKYLSERASDYIDSRTEFIISKKGLDSFPDELRLRIKKACCSAVEAIKINDGGGTMISEKVGDYSRTFAQSALTDEQRLDNAVMMYIPDLIKAARWI